MMKKSESFSGPLFIIGMPRSGTKLLRDLLNQHPEISIPESESHFIPYFIRKYSKGFEEKLKTSAEELHQELQKTPFYLNMKRRGREMSLEEFQKGVGDNIRWDTVFKFILTFYGKNDARIWGDKTPGYLNHVSLLKKIFPEARFIHIVRDPRDYCLSVQNIWNKNMYRSAHIWNVAIKNTKKIKEKYDEDFYELHYEKLIQDPETNLRKLSSFLEVNYSDDMLYLTSPSESYGDAKGMTKIKKDNSSKFVSQLSENQITKVEEIVKPTMEKMGYQCKYASTHVPLTRFEFMFYKLLDGINSVFFHIKDKGLLTGISYFVKLHKRSSWHNN